MIVNSTEYIQKRFAFDVVYNIQDIIDENIGNESKLRQIEKYIKWVMEVLVKEPEITG